MPLTDKVVIVTGAARGIGRACAERFVKEGAIVVLADIDEETGEQAAKDLVETGHTARFVPCDIGERLDVHNLIAETLDAYDRIDVLINNAARLDSGSVLELEPEEFSAVLRVNVLGTFLMSQAVAQQMVAQIDKGGPPGAIINMSSVGAVFGLADHAAYSVSKGAVAQLTKSFALALAETGIRVNAIGPGSVKTEMLAEIASDEIATARILSRTPMGRFAEPSEIAAIAVFLASDEASYITGTTIYADGGRLPLNYTVEVPEKA